MSENSITDGSKKKCPKGDSVGAWFLAPIVIFIPLSIPIYGPSPFSRICATVSIILIAILLALPPATRRMKLNQISAELKIRVLLALGISWLLIAVVQYSF